MDHDLSPAVKRGGFVNRTRWKLPWTVNPNDLIDTGIEGVLVTEDEGYDVTTGMTTSDLKLKDEIPQMFEVSLAGFEVKDHIRVSNFLMPVGIEPSRILTKHPDFETMSDVIVGNVRGKKVVSMADGGDLDEEEA